MPPIAGWGSMRAIFYRHCARSRAIHVAPKGAGCSTWAVRSTDISPVAGLNISILTELGIFFLLENYAPVGAAIDLNYQGIVEADVADQAIIVERLFHR